MNHSCLLGRNARARAFTLLELLVATLIFSVLIGALYSVLFGALRLRETAHEAVESGLPREQLNAILRRDLTNMVVPAGLLAGALTGTAVEEGTRHLDTMTFYTTTGLVTAGAPWGEIQKVEYRLETPADGNTAGGYDLLRVVTRNLLASTTIEETTDAQLAQWRLARGVDSLEIAYWDGEQWLDDWDTTATGNENPKAVWMKVHFNDGTAFSLAPGEGTAAKPERPLELVCEITPQPRPTPAAGASGGGDSGPNPQPTPQPTLPPGPANPNPAPAPGPGPAPGGGGGGR